MSTTGDPNVRSAVGISRNCTIRRSHNMPDLPIASSLGSLPSTLPSTISVAVQGGGTSHDCLYLKVVAAVLFAVQGEFVAAVREDAQAVLVEEPATGEICLDSMATASPGACDPDLVWRRTKRRQSPGSFRQRPSHWHCVDEIM